MDWNVFFSTVSQTSGAIVGIFAAFLITKIVANQSEYLKNKEKVTDSVYRSKALEHEADTRYFQWYNKRITERELEEISILYHKTLKILSAQEYYEALNFSPFQSAKDALSEIQKKVDEITKLKLIEDERLRVERLRFNSELGVLTQSSIHSPLNLFALSESVTQERKLIDNLLIRTTQQSKMNHELSISLSSGSESSRLVSVSIIAVILLFFSGVVYPLSFLPLQLNAEIQLSFAAFWDVLFSLKGLLLTLISLIFCGLMCVFLFINHTLRHNQDALEELKKYSLIDNYSIYFKNYSEFKTFRQNSMPADSNTTP